MPSNDALSRISQNLNDIEKQIILLRYGTARSCGHTQKQVGEMLGISPEVVSQKETSALIKMRMEARKLGINFDDHLPD